MEVKELVETNSKLAIYLCFAIVLLLSIAFANLALVGVSLVFLLASVVYSASAHIINPILARKFNINLIQEGYLLSENLKVAVKKEQDEFKAKCVCILHPSSRISGQSEKFEEIIAKSKFPFEFSIQISEIESKKIMDAYETKRRIKEIEISRTSPLKSDSISKLNRELEVIEGEIQQLALGVTPTKALFKLKCSAKGASQSQAANLATSRMSTLLTLFSTTYNLSANELLGEELLANLVD